MALVLLYGHQAACVPLWNVLLGGLAVAFHFSSLLTQCSIKSHVAMRASAGEENPRSFYLLVRACRSLGVFCIEKITCSGMQHVGREFASFFTLPVIIKSLKDY